MSRRNRSLPQHEWILVKRADRRNVVIKYRRSDEVDWRPARSSGVTTKKEAGKIASALVAKWLAESELPESSEWSEFRSRYADEFLSGLPYKTHEAFQTAANQLERLCGPRSVQELDEKMFSKFAAELRKAKYSPATIQAYRDHLMSALKWAKQMKIIHVKPEPPSLPDRDLPERGRPILREEAERIVMQLPNVVGSQHAATWAWNLEALWRSGFRIGETLVFYWDREPGMHFIENLDGDRPRIVIKGVSEKGGRNRTIPMTPDFASLLRAVPPAKRIGPVFRWPLSTGETTNVKTIGKKISAAGQAAGVITGERVKRTRGKPPEVVPQYATAHCWRKSFGDRMSAKVPELVLMVLMRHSSIETTRKFYVGKNSDRLADAVWGANDTDFGDTFGDTLDSLFASGISEFPETPQNADSN